MLSYVIKVYKDGKQVDRIELNNFSGHAAMDELKYLRASTYKTEEGYTLVLMALL